MKFFAALGWAILFLIHSLNAQSPIQPGTFTCTSSWGPLPLYLGDQALQKALQAKIDSVLLQYQGKKLSAPIVWSGNDKTTKEKKNTPPALPDNGPNALSFSLEEISPLPFIQAEINENPADSAKANRLKAVWNLRMSWNNPTGQPLKKSLQMLIRSPAFAPGLGLAYGNLPVTAKAFVDILTLGITQLVDSTAQMEGIEITSWDTYLGDDFLLGLTQNATTSPLALTKGILTWKQDKTQQILRWGELFYEEVVLNKKDKYPFSPEQRRYMENRGQDLGSSFVILRQELRDVVLDQNGQLEMLAEAVPLRGIAPLQQYTHVVRNGNDTLAQFQIAYQVRDSSRHFFVDRVSNGVDPQILTALGPAQAPIPVVLDMVFKGKYAGEDFEVHLLGGRTIAEWYWKGKKAAIALSNTRPEKIALLEKETPLRALNFFLLLALNPYFSR